MWEKRNVSFLLSDHYGPGSSACNQEFVGHYFNSSGAGFCTRAAAESGSRNNVEIWFIPLGSRHPLAASLTSGGYFHSQNLIVFPLS